MTTDRQRPYQFGDSDLAGDRLRLLAEVFAPSTRQFLAQFAARAPRHIADLGCGPGYTSRLLAELFPAATIHGLDSSERFIARAAQSPHERIRYDVADVTRSLPGGPYELIYARYLLAHLPDARGVVVHWCTELTSGGMLAIEENQWIDARQRAFARYLEIVAALLSDSGRALYVGAEVDAVDDWQSIVKVSSEALPIAVPDRLAARMFVPNLQTWRREPFVERHHSAQEIDQLERELRELADQLGEQSSITFGRRRMVFARA